MGMLAGVTDCRRSRKWGCRGRLALGFKPRCGSQARGGTHGFGREGGGPCGLGKSQDHVALGYSLLPCDLGSRKDFTWKKKGEKTLAGEPWEGPSHMALD